MLPYILKHIAARLRTCLCFVIQCQWRNTHRYHASSHNYRILVPPYPSLVLRPSLPSVLGEGMGTRLTRHLWRHREFGSPVHGTPAQNTLAILEPPSKIRWGNPAPCGAPRDGTALNEFDCWPYMRVSVMVNLRDYLKSVWSYFIMADYAAEIEVWSNGEAKRTTTKCRTT